MRRSIHYMICTRILCTVSPCCIRNHLSRRKISYRRRSSSCGTCVPPCLLKALFKSMLFTIAKNHVIDVFRQQINRPDFEDYIRFCEDEHLLDNTSVEKIYYDDFIDKLAIAKQKLTPAQRNIFEMSREEGMSNAEIAALSDISEQTVKNHLSAALKILREELRKYNYLFALFI